MCLLRTCGWLTYVIKGVNRVTFTRDYLIAFLVSADSELRRWCLLVQKADLRFYSTCSLRCRTPE